MAKQYAGRRVRFQRALLIAAKVISVALLLVLRFQAANSSMYDRVMYCSGWTASSRAVASIHFGWPSIYA